MSISQDNATLHRHFVQKKTEVGETFQKALGNYLLDKETVNSLGSIICGDATIDYLILGDAVPVAEQYAASIYHQIQAQQPVWPFTNQKQCPDAQNARECYRAAYEAYTQHQTPLALLAFYKDQYLTGRAYLATIAAYLTREEKNKEEREKERPHWKIFWQDLQKKQKHAVQLTDPAFASLLATQKMYHTLTRGYTEIKTLGKTARDILETKFYGLAYAEAKKYQRPEFEMDELIDEAMMGIRAATERYDYKRGILFTTYAKFWTKAKLNRFTEQRRACNMHLRHKIHETINVLELVERDLRQQLTCEPSDTILLKEMIERGYKEEVVREALSVMRQQVLFLDHESAHEKVNHLLEFISDPQERDITEEISQHRLTQNMRQALIFLEPRQRLVLELRYRVYDTQPDKHATDLMSLEQVAEIVSAREGSKKKFSRELMRQVETKAFNRLREIIQGPEFSYVQAALEHE